MNFHTCPLSSVAPAGEDPASELAKAEAAAEALAKAARHRPKYIPLYPCDLGLLKVPTYSTLFRRGYTRDREPDSLRRLVSLESDEGANRAEAGTA